MHHGAVRPHLIHPWPEPPLSGSGLQVNRQAAAILALGADRSWSAGTQHKQADRVGRGRLRETADTIIAFARLNPCHHRVGHHRRQPVASVIPLTGLPRKANTAVLSECLNRDSDL